MGRKRKLLKKIPWMPPPLEAEQLGRAMHRARRSMGVTRAGAENLLGIGKGTIKHWEPGANGRPLRNLGSHIAFIRYLMLVGLVAVKESAYDLGLGGLPEEYRTKPKKLVKIIPNDEGEENA